MRILAITNVLGIGSEGYSAYCILNELAKIEGNEVYVITNSVDDYAINNHFVKVKELRLNTRRRSWTVMFKIYTQILTEIFLIRYDIDVIQQVYGIPATITPILHPSVPFLWTYALYNDPSFVPGNLVFEDDKLLFFGEPPDRFRNPGVHKYTTIRKLFDAFAGKLITGFSNVFREIVFPKVLNRFSMIIAGDSLSFNYYKKITNTAKVVLLPETIDLSEFAYTPPPRNKMLLTLATLYAHEGTDVAITAMKKIVDAIPDSKLHVLGGGPQRKFLEKLTDELGLSRNVFFHGYVPRREVHSYFEMCSVILLPSFIKSGGLTQKEAMAAGRPVVATRTQGYTDSITDGVEGFLVAVGDSEGMADAAIRLINNYDMVLEMSRNARKKSEQTFDSALSARILHNIIHQIKNS